MSSKRLRILLIGPTPPPMGGIVRYGQDIISSELAKQHEIVFFNDSIPWKYRPASTSEKFTWNIIKRDGLCPTVKVFSFAIKRMIVLNQILRRGNFDLMHVLSTAGFGFFRNALHTKIAKRHKVKCIFHLLGQIDDLYLKANPLLKRLISCCLNMADVHIVQSPGLADFVQKITKRPVYSIFNGVRTEEFTPPDRYAHSSDGNIRLISVGTLGHKKGTFDILEAAASMKDKWSNLKFIFIGGGEVDKFRQLAIKKKISGQVKFLDSADDARRTKMLQTSDVFILPSYAEGQPIALLEAMAAGLPIISSTVGSIPEVVQEKNGFLVRPGDINAIIKYIETLTTNPKLREQMGCFNAQEAQKKYQLNRVMQEIGDIYNKVTN